MTRARDVADSALVHIATEDFSAVSTVSLNNVFSSAYDNYKIVLEITTSTVAQSLMQLKVSGTDATGANYSSKANNLSSTFGNTNDYVNTTSWAFYASTTADIYREMFLARPNTTKTTYGHAFGSVGTSGTITENGFSHNLTTAYDGFKLFPNTGTITGYVKVYGYRN